MSTLSARVRGSGEEWAQCAAMSSIVATGLTRSAGCCRSRGVVKVQIDGCHADELTLSWCRLAVVQLGVCWWGFQALTDWVAVVDPITRR